ncbi:uncharacterized protein LOC143591453 [Bidens hawaiensis]|uniref:uncharacterized protein LOC143591453 n=1 Tax=Bidens hawaiensis TaxID=980011 RepID=UPI00404B0A66
MDDVSSIPDKEDFEDIPVEVSDEDEDDAISDTVFSDQDVPVDLRVSNRIAKSPCRGNDVDNSSDGNREAHVGDVDSTTSLTKDQRKNRKRLWLELLNLLQAFPGWWVFLGDFNDTRVKVDRLSVSGNDSDMAELNNFIARAALSEYNMGDRRFTWMSEDELVKSSWSSGSVGNSKELNLMRKLKRLKNDIKEWRFSLNEVEKADLVNLAGIIEEIEVRAESSGISAGDKEVRVASKKKIFEINQRKNLDLRQKAKIKWDVEGDENSRFFHGNINGNIKRSTINGLSLNGNWECDPDLWLERPFSLAELKDVVWDCGSDKSPGPDGFTFKFIKTFWEVMKDDFFDFVKEFEQFGLLKNGCNSAFISLLPKIKDPMAIKDFRPITLIGCMSKVISKILASRLKKVIPLIIGVEQTAYIEGINILDGHLIATEVSSWVKSCKKKCLLLKVDFDKAVDSVNWAYLDSVLEQMGFGFKWRSWINSCLSSGKASILVNGSPTSEFFFKRGVKQGDPLSQFLFIIAMEGLNVVMKSASEQNLFKGVQLPNNGPLVSHVMYTDGVMFIGKWKSSDSVNLARLLRCFHLSSGLKVNFHKSKVF